MYISHVHCAPRYMCTFVRTSERDGWRRTKSIFSFSFFSSSSSSFVSFSLSLSHSQAEKRKSLKFSLVRTNMLLLKPEFDELRLAAAESLTCGLLILDFSTRCRVSPPYHSHVWYTPWSVFKTGRLETSWCIVWQSLPTGAAMAFPRPRARF
jgi:hypothetical protein